MPTAAEASMPLGQTTCGLPPAAPYRSRSRTSSQMIPMHRRQVVALCVATVDDR